jgi:bifunctional non-homologous end joining protein LigD
VRLIFRNRTNFDSDYPRLLASLKSLTAKEATIDGEITARGRWREDVFPASSNVREGKRTPLVYYAFDLLFLDGTDLRARPLTERRKLLAKLLKNTPPNIRFSEELSGTKEELLQVAQQFHLEGLIAKRPDSLYEAGRRSGAWVKVKLTQQQEFVIGGYTPPEGSRNTSARCSWVTTAQTDYFSPAESAPASLKRPWSICMRTCRRSSGQPAPS